MNVSHRFNAHSMKILIGENKNHIEIAIGPPNQMSIHSHPCDRSVVWLEWSTRWKQNYLIYSLSTYRQCRFFCLFAIGSKEMIWKANHKKMTIKKRTTWYEESEQKKDKTKEKSGSKVQERRKECAEYLIISFKPYDHTGTHTRRLFRMWCYLHKEQ